MPKAITLLDGRCVELDLIPVIAAASVATPPAGVVELFFDASNGNRLSQKDSAGVVIDLAATGGGGGGLTAGRVYAMTSGNVFY